MMLVGVYVVRHCDVLSARYGQIKVLFMRKRLVHPKKRYAQIIYVKETPSYIQ